jgi:metallopeptidase MepB
MHDFVSKTKYSRYHGTNLTDDICETPSIMLENFCWTRQVLKSLGCHYTALKSEYLAAWKEKHQGEEGPPQTIPDEILDEFLKVRQDSRLW